MASSTKQLYLFLTACSGNWRNTVHISGQGETDNPGYLLAADQDGQPIILSVQQFYELTGVQIDPAECCGQLTEAVRNAYQLNYTFRAISSDMNRLMMAIRGQ